MFHSDAKVRDALNRGLCPDCKGHLTVRLDDPCHEVTVICGCRHPLGTVYNQDDVYPEVLELGRRQQQPEGGPTNKTPWRICGQGTLNNPVTGSPVNTIVLESEGFGRFLEIYDYNEDENNTRKILRAVNAHEKLVEALHYIKDDLENNGEIMQSDEKRIQFIESILALAEK